MAFKIIWSEPSIGDLREVTDYIAGDNQLAAERTGAAILARVKLLVDHPLIGRMVPEIERKEIRELIQRPYRIVYRVNARGKIIEILRVWHAARGEPNIDESGT